MRRVPGRFLAALLATGVSPLRGSEVRVAELDATGAPGPYRPVVSSTSSRNILIADLVPGQLYAYQGRKFGGTTTFSDWSDVLVQRAA